jgi:hypothetical protein
MGKRPELTGGGLVRSVGGWLNLMEMRRAKVFVKGDERILEWKGGRSSKNVRGRETVI